MQNLSFTGVGPVGTGLGGVGMAPNNGGGCMNCRSPLYPNGHDIMVIPQPSCSGLKNTANALKVIGGAGAIYKGISISIVASGGTDLPEAGLALGIAGIAGGSGTILGVAADWQIGCTP
jgi:hypothetical protein